MNSAFEDAFYQLDSNRDGVVTLPDLERYVRDNHLKDKFIQKWLTLFGDERNVIYYDKFCETMGIVPALEKFEQKTYKIDMTEDTRKLVTDVINQFRENDNELSDETLIAINERLSDLLGDSWNIKINPTKSDLNVEYAPDGYLYYAPNNTEKPKILVYREIPFQPKTLVYNKDMSEKTEESIQNIMAQHIVSRGPLTDNNLDDIINTIENKHGDKWGIILNPSLNDLEVPYEEDGILYYTLEKNEDPKILVWRKPEEVDQVEPKIYTADMTEDTKKFITETVDDYLKKDDELADDTLNAITRKLSSALGDKWQIKKDPTSAELGTKYASDGLLYYCPNERETPKLLVYRENKELHNGIDHEIIHDCKMSNSVKDGVLKSVRQNYIPGVDKTPKVEKIIRDLNEAYGPTWNVLINPNEKDLKVDFDFEGKIYFTPNSKDTMKLLIWRKDKEKNRGRMCFCCF